MIAKWKTTREEFVTVWQKSRCLSDAANRLKVHPAWASSRARELRLKGIPLRRFDGRGGPDSHEVEFLKNLAIEQYGLFVSKVKTKIKSEAR